MSKRLEGMLQGKGLKFGVVVSRFNEFFTEKLLEGAKDALVRHGVEEDDIEVARTPGSFDAVRRSHAPCHLRFPAVLVYAHR